MTAGQKHEIYAHEIWILFSICQYFECVSSFTTLAFARQGHKVSKMLWMHSTQVVRPKTCQTRWLQGKNMKSMHMKFEFFFQNVKMLSR